MKKLSIFIFLIKRFKFFVVFLSLLILSSISIFITLNNENFCFNVIMASGSPKIDKFFFERILKISAKKNITQIVINNIEKNNHPEKTAIYLTSLGIIGDEQSLPVFLSMYVGCQDSQKSDRCLTIQNFCILGIGLSGNSSYAGFLLKMIENYQYHKTSVDWHSIAESLYLMTGKTQGLNMDKSTADFIPWGSIKKARYVIEKSKGRKRTIEEMMILYDYVF